jgi:hypothetical protein
MNKAPHRAGQDATEGGDGNEQHNPTALPTGFQLIVVELLCVEAVDLAPGILPATPAAFGRCWIYRVSGRAAIEQFEDPVTREILFVTRDVTSEFANVAESAISPEELLRAVARLAAFCLARRHCDGVVDDDDETLIRALDNLADANVTERIIVWLDYPPADT